MPRNRTIASAAGLTLAATAGVVAYAAINAESQLFGRTVVAPPNTGQVYLTFDDGPNPAATPQLLDVLARHSVRATFFVIGDFVRREPDLTRRIAAAGHALGNHTMHHRYLTLLPLARVREELSACNRAIEDATGATVRLFRPPHGARRPAVLEAAAALGLTTVQYNLIVGDWKPLSGDIIFDRITQGVTRNRRRGRGSNIVLHDGGQAGLGQPRLPTVAAVERLLSLHPASAFVTPLDHLTGAARASMGQFVSQSLSLEPS